MLKKFITKRSIKKKYKIYQSEFDKLLILFNETSSYLHYDENIDDLLKNNYNIREYLNLFFSYLDDIEKITPYLGLNLESIQNIKEKSNFYFFSNDKNLSFIFYEIRLISTPHRNSKILDNFSRIINIVDSMDIPDNKKSELKNLFKQYINFYNDFQEKFPSMYLMGFTYDKGKKEALKEVYDIYSSIFKCLTNILKTIYLK